MGLKIVSGGQTGVDRAALDTAIELGLPHGGWVPKGRRAEDGIIPEKYRVTELPAREYAARTEKNVVDSDGTLILSRGELAGGSALTARLARKHRRPCLHVDLAGIPPEAAPGKIRAWMKQHRIKVLNVAGPRASGDPKIYGLSREILIQALCRKRKGDRRFI